MATDLKRFTISVTPSMEAELDSAKKERYYRGTQNDMIRDLINRGLASLKDESNRQIARMKRNGVDPDKIKNANTFIFEYLCKEGFSLLEVEYLMSSMGCVMQELVKDDPLRKVAEFDYSSSVDHSFSCKAASNTKS